MRTIVHRSRGFAAGVAVVTAGLLLGATGVSAEPADRVRESEVEISGPIARPSAVRESQSVEAESSPSQATGEPAVEPTPCASPTPGAPEETGPLACVAVQSLNPSSIPSGSPKISDKADGVDELFDLVAVVSGATSGIHVRSTLTVGSTQVAGDMEQVPGSTDTWTLPLDLSSSLPEGSGSVVVEAFRGPQAGAQLLSSDTVTVDVQHKDPPSSGLPNPMPTDFPAMETAAITWPTQNGPLGFYKPIDGQWRTVIDGLLSAGANATFTAYYTVSAIGREPVWTSCGTGSNPPARESDGIRPFSVSCALAEEDLPSRVTAVAVVPQRSTPTTTTPRNDIGAADVHRVQPYLQDADDMNIALRALPPASITAAWPSGARRAAGTGCLDVAALVTDQFDRPVQGANVDVELQGPSDAVAFGSGASTFQVPFGFVEEDASNCSGGPDLTQAAFPFDQGPDAKRVESDLGSGLSGGGAELGEWRFKVFSPSDAWGRTRIYAWVDGQPRSDELQEPAIDNEVHDATEPLAALDLKWLERATSIAVSSPADTSPVDACNPYEFIVAGGDVPLDGVNVDVHIRGPNPEIRFCDPPGATPLRKPDAGEHGTEEEPGGDTHPPNTPHCTGEGQPCIHREGETDPDGRLIFGLSSDVSGTTTVTAWFDGERGTDDDLDNLTGTSVVATTSWITDAADAKISLTNPSAYAGSPRTISDAHFRVVASVNAPYAVEGVDIELSSDAGSVTLGRAKQVAGDHTYEFDWDLEASPLPGQEDGAEPGPVPDGAYTLKAKVVGQAASAEAAITVDRVQGAPQDPAPHEWVEIGTPVNGTAVSLVDRAIRVTGTASPAAEGLDLYYSVTPPGETVAWATPSCGYVDLAGSGGADPQEFEGTCRLGAAHSPGQVTAIAAVAIDCTLLAGCDASPTGSPAGSRNPVTPETGDAIRVNGCEDLPCVLVGPTETIDDMGTCKQVHIVAVDEKGPIPGATIDAALEGPGDKSYFCNPLGIEGPSLRSPKMKGTTDESGSIVVGVGSSKSSFKSVRSDIEKAVTTLTAWIDGNGDGSWGGGEPKGESIFHWRLPGRCTLVGTPGDDHLIAQSAPPNKICGLGGDDLIEGLDGLTGNDLILGGPGNDTILGKRGDDVIRGGSGNDVILGDKGDDEIYGGSGNDDLFGDAGKDKLHGGKGRDGCAKGKDGGSKRSCERKAKAPQEMEAQ